MHDLAVISRGGILINFVPVAPARYYAGRFSGFEGSFGGCGVARRGGETTQGNFCIVALPPRVQLQWHRGRAGRAVDGE